MEVKPPHQQYSHISPIRSAPSFLSPSLWLPSSHATVNAGETHHEQLKTGSQEPRCPCQPNPIHSVMRRAHGMNQPRSFPQPSGHLDHLALCSTIQSPGWPPSFTPISQIWMRSKLHSIAIRGSEVGGVLTLRFREVVIRTWAVGVREWLLQVRDFPVGRGWHGPPEVPQFFKTASDQGSCGEHHDTLLVSFFEGH